MIVIYSCIIRFLFIILTGRFLITNWTILIITTFLSIFISYFVYSEFLIQRDFLIPSRQDIATALWFAFIGYLYKTINTITTISLEDDKDKKYILKMKDELSEKFDKIIKEKTKNDEEYNLIYAVMIYENFNRGYIFRFIERKLFFTGLIKTTGIMQVTSKKCLSDIESINLGVDILLAKYREELKNDKCEYEAMHESIKKYNPDIRYINNVRGIFNILNDKDYF